MLDLGCAPGAWLQVMKFSLPLEVGKTNKNIGC